ncbi:MAG TPA: hypothetical protein VI893_04540 [Thermoplasmata archaeon]|nr:hypothetical protein [Thermoplasmata archaeon]
MAVSRSSRVRLMPLVAASSLAVVGLLFSGCLGGSGTSVLYDEDRDVGQQKVAAFPVHNLRKGTGLHFDAKLLKGSRADFVWMNASELPKYLDQANGTYDYIERCSGLNTAGLVGDCPIEADGSYYFVVDNTQRPVNGANPEPDGIRAHVKISTL